MVSASCWDLELAVQEGGLRKDLTCTCRVHACCWEHGTVQQQQQVWQQEASRCVRRAWQNYGVCDDPMKCTLPTTINRTTHHASHITRRQLVQTPATELPRTVAGTTRATPVPTRVAVEAHAFSAPVNAGDLTDLQGTRNDDLSPCPLLSCGLCWGYGLGWYAAAASPRPAAGAATVFCVGSGRCDDAGAWRCTGVGATQAPRPVASQRCGDGVSGAFEVVQRWTRAVHWTWSATYPAC